MHLNSALILLYGSGRPPFLICSASRMQQLIMQPTLPSMLKPFHPELRPYTPTALAANPAVTVSLSSPLLFS